MFFDGFSTSTYIKVLQILANSDRKKDNCTSLKKGDDTFKGNEDNKC